MTETPASLEPHPKKGRLRQGGRLGKQGHSRSSHEMCGPYIDRKIGIFSVLDEEGLSIIERNADTILQEIGMDFRGDDEILRLLADAGADVKGERVRFERGMCRKIIQATAPREFTWHARNLERSLHFGGKSAIFAPSVGSPFVHDLDAGRRYGSLQDFQNLQKIIQSLNSLHKAGGHVCEIVDVPVAERHLHDTYEQFRLTDKAISGSVNARERAVF